MSAVAALRTHDFTLFTLALFVSMVFCTCALGLIPRSRKSGRWPLARTLLAGVLLGCTMWVVLLLSWKCFFPFVQVSIPVATVIAALGLAILGSVAVVATLTYGEAGIRNTLLAGSILAASASCMLFMTMSALAEPLVLGYQLSGILASMIGCTLLSSFGLHQIKRASSWWRKLLPCMLVAIAIPVLDVASFTSILPFTDWEAAAATPGALALQPLTVVFLSEFAAILALTRAGAAVDRQMAARTQRENARLRQLTDSTFEGLVVHHADRIVDANSAFCAMTGLALDEIKGRPVHDFTPEFDARPGGPAVETELRRPNGETLPVEILSRTINLGQGDVQVTAVRDIQERRAAEQAERDRRQVIDLRRETEEARERQRIAEAASRAKSAFLAMMSHEIRTPMNAVLGLASTLLEDSLTADQRAVVEVIHASGGGLLRILNDILDFSRLDAGGMTFEMAPFSLAALTAELRSVHSPAAVEKGLSLSIEENPAVPPRLIGDVGRITQVLRNLISNAIKFTEVGTVSVRTRSWAAGGNNVTVEWTVTDTGPGIAPDKLPSLFDAFVQADISITRRFGGSGLGLAISKQLVNRMGGEISVTSVLGSGSVFMFRLTLERAGRPVAAVVGQAQSDDSVLRRLGALGRPLRLLLAEDNSVNQFVFGRIMKGLPVLVDIAADGRQAIQMAQETAYDVICMDMSMPVMDGLEATRLIRRGNGPCRGVPIVAMTANAFPEDVEACRAAGMNDFVSKPISKHSAIDAILRAMPRVDETATAAV